MTLATRGAAPGRSVPAPRSRPATPGRQPRPGRPRSGAGTLAAPALAAVPVPVLLVAAFRAVEPSDDAWLLALVLGLVVDVLLGILLLGLGTYRSMGRQLLAQRRALQEVEARAWRQDATLRRRPEVRSSVETAADRLGTPLGSRPQRPRTCSRPSTDGVPRRRGSATQPRPTCCSCSCRRS